MAPRKGSRLRRNIHLLRALHEAKPQRRKALLKAADPDLVECLSDCCQNIIHGNIPLAGGRKKALIQKKLLVRKVADKKNPHQESKATFSQSERWRLSQYNPSPSGVGAGCC